MANQRSIITIATGKSIYVDMAANLARSFIWWHPDSPINFTLFTDQPRLVPADLREKIEIKVLKPGELGEGFSSKLWLDKLAAEGQTLFIDSDCLIYGELAGVFDLFSGRSVSVVGSYISQGEWFGDIAAVCKKFGVAQLPKFNGGIYYLEKGEVVDKVYQTARDLEKQYDDIGFVRLRNRPNDEVLMALAMALHSQQPIADDGSILAEFVNFASGIKSDLLSGRAELYNTPTGNHYNANWPLTVARPLVVHYLGHHNQTLPYLKEAKQLALIYAGTRSAAAAKRAAFLQVTLPAKIKSTIRDTFRPLYRALFGTREVKRSERIID